MNILSLDTSTSYATIAIAVDDRIVAESVLSTDRTLSARLVSEIERLLATAGLEPADIDIFSSSTGPGSFTGVRGGIATIQGLALATGKPCVGFSSLAMLAMNFSLALRPVCPLLDARKSEVYGALFDCSTQLPTPVIDDCVLSPAHLLERITGLTSEPVIFLGDGACRYRDQITEVMGVRAIFPPFPLNTGHAAHGITLALESLRKGHLLPPDQLLPTYLRASDAELMKPKPPHATRIPAPTEVTP